MELGRNGRHLSVSSSVGTLLSYWPCDEESLRVRMDFAGIRVNYVLAYYLGSTNPHRIAKASVKYVLQRSKGGMRKEHW
jgi:hypothetical protein